MLPPGSRVIISRRHCLLREEKKKGLLFSQQGVTQVLPEELVELPLSRHLEAVPGNKLL